MRVMNTEPDWGDDPNKPPQPLWRGALRVLAFLLGAGLTLAGLSGFVFLVVCSRWFTKGDSMFTMNGNDSAQLLVLNIAASVSGYLLLEFGATNRTTYWRMGIAIAGLIIAAVFISTKII